MNKTKVALAIGSLVVVLGLILAIGCSSTTSTPTSTPSQTTTAATTTTSVQPIVLKVGGYGAATYPMRIMMEEANKMIEERSAGRIKINWFPAESLVKMADLYDAIPAGTVDIGITAANYKPDLTGILADVANMPFNFNMEKFQQHYRDPGGFYDFQKPIWEKNGLYLLSWGLTGGFEIQCRTPVHTSADLKGKLIRTVKGMDVMIKLFGGEPVFISTSETYEAAQRGTIDGATASISSAKTMSLHEVLPYFTIGGFTQANLEIVMGTKIRQTMPQDLVKLIDDVYIEAERNHNARLKGLIDADIQFVKTYPKIKEVYILPAEERAKWMESVKQIYDDLAKARGTEWEQFWKIRNSLN